MSAAKLIAALNDVDEAERAVCRQVEVLRRELTKWHTNVEALQAAIVNARMSMASCGFDVPANKSVRPNIRAGDRILAVLKDGPCDLGSLTQRVYGASTPTERTRSTSLLNSLRRKGLVENVARGKWGLTKKETT